MNLTNNLGIQNDSLISTYMRGTQGKTLFSTKIDDKNTNMKSRSVSREKPRDNKVSWADEDLNRIDMGNNKAQNAQYTKKSKPLSLLESCKIKKEILKQKLQLAEVKLQEIMKNQNLNNHAQSKTTSIKYGFKLIGNQNSDNNPRYFTSKPLTVETKDPSSPINLQSLHNISRQSTRFTTNKYHTQVANDDMYNRLILENSQLKSKLNRVMMALN